jgi:creatinine amidohydrolase
MSDVEWINLTAKELRDLGQNGTTIAVLPVGSIEQHGPHLPVQVDALLVTEVARRTARLVAATDPIVVLPTVWSGLAEHHMSLGGTLTLDLPTFYALIRCLVRSLVRSGFRRIILINGHGGNMTAMNAIVGELSVETALPIALATYWVAAEAEFAQILDEQTTVKHACEAETSMVLALRPDLVAMDALTGVKPPAEWSGGRTDIFVWQSVESWSPSGVAGVPAAASATKGERLLDAAAAAIARRLAGGELWRGI